MGSIHLIEREDRFERVTDSDNEWESGFWAVAEPTAQALVGGNIYFHSAQAKPSFFGGIILGYRVQNEGQFTDRIVFRFRYEKSFREVRAGEGGWNMEKKIIF